MSDYAMKGIFSEMCRVDMLCDMLSENVKEYVNKCGAAGKNRNASKASILNQITTLRNELLVLEEKINVY